MRQSAGRIFDVVSVHPWDGVPVELWFDRRTHLLGRIVDRTGPQAATELSDYRRVGPVLVAFHIKASGGQGLQVDSVVFAPADRALFSLPRPASP